jgi:hypothetical protein
MTEEQARKHVAKLKEFYWNLASYLVVIPALIGVNLFTSPEFLWFVFPMLGWGFGLLGHASEVYGLPGLGSKWEARKMQELMGARQSEASTERLRALVLEAMGEKEARQRRAQDVSTERLLRRIEHLEAIVTSRDWDLVDADYRQTAPKLDLDTLPDQAPAGKPGAERTSGEEQAAYLAKRVH